MCRFVHFGFDDLPVQAYACLFAFNPKGLILFSFEDYRRSGPSD